MTPPARTTRGTRNARGTTLIEALMAAAVLVLGILSLLSAQLVAAAHNQSAAKQERALALAQDLLGCVDRWPEDDARLSDSVPANNALSRYSERSAAAPDPADFDLDVNAATHPFGAPISSAVLDGNGDGQPDFRRYLTVAPAQQNGVTIGTRITVTIVWPEMAAWKTLHLFHLKYASTLNGAAVPGL